MAARGARGLSEGSPGPGGRHAHRSISATLAAQHPEGFWVKPGPGYGPKYTGTVWSLMFLDQFGADPGDRRIQRACAYVLDHAQARAVGSATTAGTAVALHCLHGSLLRALIGFGWLEDDRVRAAIEWQARSITGEGFVSWYRGATSGPEFSCGVNGGLPCAWGAIKALRGLVRIPPGRRSPLVRRAIQDGVQFLLSRDPAVAAYPAKGRVSPNWFKLGFPSGYAADMLDNLDVLADLGHAKDPRLAHALEVVLAKQDDLGRWKNEYPYGRTTWVRAEDNRSPSKWVTLRACRVLKAALENDIRTARQGGESFGTRR